MSEVKTRTTLEHDGTLVVERVQDCEPTIERNKYLQTVEQRSDCWRHIASIDCVILEKWLNEEWARGNTTMTWTSPEFDAVIRKKLNDPDWRYLRTDSKAPRYMAGASIESK